MSTNDNLKPEDKNINQNIDPNNPNPAPEKTSEEIISQLVAQRVNEELAGIKKKLDDAYSQRDDAMKKAALIDEEKKIANLKQLEAEGKHKEVYDLKLAEMNAKLEAYERTNTELSRDVVVKDALRGLNFRNGSAEQMATSEIVSQLMRNEHGQWVHKTGVSIATFVESYTKDEEKSFLFKPKTNSGSGMPSEFGDGRPPAFTPGQDSLFKLSQQEVLALAAAGKIGNGGSRLF